MTLIVGLTGRAKSGKTTTAKAMSRLAADLGHRVEIYEFSNYILQDLKDKGFIPKYSDRDTVDVKLLVGWGSNRRKDSKEYWTSRILADISEGGDHVAIIPNIRFLDEANAFRQRNGVIVRVRTLVEEGVDWISQDRDPNHPSETENASIKADYFLQTLRNQESLLEAQARTLMKYLIKERE